MKTLRALLALTLCAYAQTPAFQTSAELVLLDVQVIHAKTGAPAPPLRTEDFQVLEEGKPQEVRQFARDEYPLDIVLLFDLTDSVRPVLRRLADGSEAALKHLKATDEVAVMAYASHAKLLSSLTSNRDETVNAIETAARMKSGEPAYFNEAVFQAAHVLRIEGKPTNRRVIIWLTDNLPNVPEETEQPVHTEHDAVQALNEEGIVVAPILSSSPLWVAAHGIGMRMEAHKRKEFPPGDARKYAELSGGQAIKLRGNQPEERLAELIDELRARYTIGYRPSEEAPPGTFRHVEVKLDSPTLRRKEWLVRTRSGYYRK